ncbi:MAG: protein phosphatase 2C domain-containing protein [Gammaproteobacteria bacterium]|nr:protein phosphatase 2C domain-containing protein [Gammaproteobacteria bacterium]
MKYQLSKTTRLGNRVVNEDRIGVVEHDNAVLLVLADGMGGYRGGQIASRSLVNRMLRQFQRSTLPVDDPGAYLKELIADAHLAVLRAGNEQYPPIEPRTTCVVCLIQNGCAWWAHVGDSRLYLFRGGKPCMRTTDHSRIEEMRRKGKLSVEELDNHPQRHLVTRCVGYQKHPPIPTVSEKIPLEKYDMILLCSDGLWGPLTEDSLADTLSQNTLDQAVERIAYQAEFRSYPAADNISLITFRWISDEITPPQKPEKVDTEPDELMQTLDALDHALGKQDS